MKKSLKELYQTAIIIKDSSLDGKINQVERTPEQLSMHEKLLDAYQRMKSLKTVLNDG